MFEIKKDFLNIPFLFCIYFQLRKIFITAFGLYLCTGQRLPSRFRCLGARDGGILLQSASSRCTGFGSSCSRLRTQEEGHFDPAYLLEAGHKLPQGEGGFLAACVSEDRGGALRLSAGRAIGEAYRPVPSCRWGGCLSGICSLELALNVLLLITWAFMVGDDTQPGSSGVHRKYQ